MLKLLQNLDMFAYRVDRVVIFYQHASPYYTLMGQALEEQGVALEMHRYSELQLNMDYLSQFHMGEGGYSLLFFDDATSLVENNKKFNHLIHVARHSGLIFVLSIHGIVFTRASSRAMVLQLFYFRTVLTFLLLGAGSALHYFHYFNEGQADDISIHADAC